MKKGLIGYMFQDKPKNVLEKFWWKIKSIFGWKNKTGIPIIISNKITKDQTTIIYNGK